MQTIKVQQTSTAYGVAFSIQGGNFLAAVGRDFYNRSKWAGKFGSVATVTNLDTLADAVEHIGDAITRHFASFGLNVEFTA